MPDEAVIAILNAERERIAAARRAVAEILLAEPDDEEQAADS